ncbi:MULTISPECIES: hypothetical protein [unclassified Mycobacterium]|uniref:hypothetical protein n=2 Tax=Mycobacterium TaxID=1763 RepID=UPI0008018E59|nr:MULTISPECIES: hypothetical protein [unclassified Mycobacterium]OBG55476.1 hypothetical protein A5704_25215 [Mycobacterium sp. E735]OBG65742.1 hypothetical protein A5703_15045 [Mycobacterium sp. E188]OBG79708.1 hypothetical protein A9X05_21940 [Mycobacterium sp. E3298]OBH32109.1 hypothetical protein A9X03_00540 [Mycobacterium sp. E1715]OBH37471.1 hypothetical protein A5691_26445 [Mycobacterium sp. E183]
MALVSRTPEQGRRREVGRQVARFADTASSDEDPAHPTLAEIARRKQEIEAWEAFDVGGYRFAKPGTIIGALVSAVLVVLVLTPLPPNWPWDIPTMILAVFTAVATVTCGLLWFDNPHPLPRPDSLVIVPFTRAENLRLMAAQPVEPYRAICACPGCGDTSAHLIREPGKDEPDWAMVTRRCAVCEREWAQS